jgi:ATP-dependent Clp protease ATP-binding subunit ClpC
LGDGEQGVVVPSSAASRAGNPNVWPFSRERRRLSELEDLCKDFTDRARKVYQLASQNARRLNHEYIGTEHVLLGVIEEGSGVAASALKNMDVDLRKIHLEIEKLVRSGPEMVTLGKLPWTPRTKKVIEYSREEARNMNHNYVDTEHILLGLLREREGVAAAVLTSLGIGLERARTEVGRLPGQPE